MGGKKMDTEDKKLSGERKEQTSSSEEILMKGHLLERKGRAEIRIVILTRSSPGWYFLM